MAVGRGAQTETLLGGGRVLIVGGVTTGGAALASAEIYDPTTRTFSLVGSMHEARGLHTATLLQDGRVLVAGGSAIGSDSVAEKRAIASAEIYDPGDR